MATSSVKTSDQLPAAHQTPARGGGGGYLADPSWHPDSVRDQPRVLCPLLSLVLAVSCGGGHIGGSQLRQGDEEEGGKVDDMEHCADKAKFS